jgi:hypothetical protein
VPAPQLPRAIIVHTIREVTMADLYLQGAPIELDIRPRVVRSGDRIHVAFRAPRIPGATSVPRYDVTVWDGWRRRVATLMREPVRPTGGVVCLDWDGRDDRGLLLSPGNYQLRVRGIGNPLQLERTLLIEW